MYWLLVSALALGAGVIAVVRARTRFARSRYIKLLAWSKIECPHCRVPFGAEAVAAASEEIYIDGPAEPTVEIRCPGCLRYFSWCKGDEHQPSESTQYIGLDRIYHADAATLQAYGALHVHHDLQMTVTREDLEARLREVNPKLLERIEFVSDDPQ